MNSHRFHKYLNWLAYINRMISSLYIDRLGERFHFSHVLFHNAKQHMITCS